MGGMVGRGWGRSKREGIYVYIGLIHFVVQQKLTQHCKAIIPQLNKQTNKTNKKQIRVILRGHGYVVKVEPLPARGRANCLVIPLILGSFRPGITRALPWRYHYLSTLSSQLPKPLSNLAPWPVGVGRCGKSCLACVSISSGSYNRMS